MKRSLAGILSVTAAMALPIVKPSFAEARNSRVIREYPKQFRIQSVKKAVYTDSEGNKILGHIYVDLNQERFTPEGQNQFHAEMKARIYFEADTATIVGNDGNTYKVQEWLFNRDDEEFGLFDLVDATSDQKRFNYYSCNSTETYCSAEQVQLIQNKGGEFVVSIDDQESVSRLNIALEDDKDGGLGWMVFFPAK